MAHDIPGRHPEHSEGSPAMAHFHSKCRCTCEIAEVPIVRVFAYIYSIFSKTPGAYFSKAKIKYKSQAS